MTTNDEWIKYPKELLQHAILHASHETDFDVKMAFICVDNSIEITIQKYLRQPPSTFTGSPPNYKELTAGLNSFCKLIERCKKHKPQKMPSADIDVVLCYYDIRNLMYHNGSGVSVTLNIVEQYIKITQRLIHGLFKIEVKGNADKLLEEHLGIYTKAYNDFLRLHRSTLRERFEGDAACWKTSIFDYYDKSLSEIFATIRQFDINVITFSLEPITIADFKKT
jgi:hypothetical protein